MSNWSRRGFLSAGLASLGAGVLAEAPLTSQWPVPRPGGLAKSAKTFERDIVGEIGLSGQTSYVVADARTGEILEARNPLLALPTASVAKFVTAQYALEALGPAHAFRTKVVATQPLRKGRIDGDLALIGGGDPMLDSDDLAAIAKSLKGLGVREVTGRILVHPGALPTLHQIDPSQPQHLSYNPSISGLNLNFNRVFFDWNQVNGSISTEMQARAVDHRPEVANIGLQLASRDMPVFDFQSTANGGTWSVARSALKGDGGRWLPVRRPAFYAGFALHALLIGQGVKVGPPVLTSAEPAGKVLVDHTSMPLARIIRSMLYYSTNHIAEVVGLNASYALGAQPKTLRASADVMNDWMLRRFGVRRPGFVDHSGLSDETAVTPRDLVTTLLRIGPDSNLASLMRKFPMPEPGQGIAVAAKTGTLNFVSGLAGFVKAGRRDLAFAILIADLDKRAAIPMDQRERPRGAKSWATRARVQDAELIMDWTRRFG